MLRMSRIESELFEKIVKNQKKFLTNNAHYDIIVIVAKRVADVV